MDGNLRGRPGNELASLIMEGVKKSKPDMPVKIIHHLEDAIRYAMDHAPKNSLIVICSEKVNETIRVIQRHKMDEDSQEPREGETGETRPSREDDDRDRRRKRS
jgi:cyanophycin synthetase